jgi:endonuclease/exonuclease/phosphatase (EEP) superfamily protein YafD
MAPVGAGEASLRNRQLDTLTGMIQMEAGREQILLGDLNITPWSPHYTRLERQAGLTNGAMARGYLPTWPAGYNPVKIPIDHCLLSEGLRVRQFRTGPDTGSDHLPIIVDVAVGGRMLHSTT